MMKEYDIYVPANYNDGMPIEQLKIDEIQDGLLANFDGLSVSREPIVGYWKDSGRVEQDFNYIYRVIAEDSEDVRNCILGLKVALEKWLNQKQIFIVVRNVEVM